MQLYDTLVFSTLVNGNSMSPAHFYILSSREERSFFDKKIKSKNYTRNKHTSHLVLRHHSQVPLGSILHQRVLRSRQVCGCTSSVPSDLSEIVARTTLPEVLHSSHFLALHETLHEECDSLRTYITMLSSTFVVERSSFEPTPLCHCLFWYYLCIKILDKASFSMLNGKPCSTQNPR